MRRTKQRQLFYLIPMLLLCFLVLTSQRANAQQSGADSAPATTQGSTVTQATVAQTVTPNDVNEVAKELWCPLCSGVRLDACELKACEQMRDMIAVQLEEGQDKEAIKDYFLDQYGPQVLGEPPLQGFNLLAWVLPVVAMIGGGFFVWRRTRSMIESAPQDQAASTPVATDSQYSQQLEEELKRYG
jgi:cytochrome c-type biogenesis protein CcmH